MKWHHWCFFWVGTSSSFGTLCHNRSIWFFQGTNGVNTMKVRVITAWSLGQEYLLRENTSNENSRVAFFWMLLWLGESRWYIRRVWLAMLVHTDANRVHVRSVGIVCLAIRLVWLFDYIWQVHADRQDPEDAGVTSDPFGYNKVNVGWTKFKANKLGWNGCHGCQFVNGTTMQCSRFLCVFLRFQWFTGML